MNKIPLFIKVLYTVFVCVLVPYYWKAYGPTNFLYFCDAALLMTLVAIWLENATLVSAAAVGILLPQLFWMTDFLTSVVGYPITRMTAYMFNDAIPRFTRFLSFFHFWLPILLVWLLSRLGYNAKGLKLWTGLAWGLMLVCYFFMPAPPASVDNPALPVNINYVYGLNDDHVQHWMPPLAYLFTMMIALPLIIYIPTHYLLQHIYGRKTS